MFIFYFLVCALGVISSKIIAMTHANELLKQYVFFLTYMYELISGLSILFHWLCACVCFFFSNAVLITVLYHITCLLGGNNHSLLLMTSAVAWRRDEENEPNM